jgi:DNA-binding transcriptional ArsR family regulator
MAATPLSKKDQVRRRETLRPHPTRDQIVDAMRSYGQPISPTRVARITGKSLGSVAYHMRILVSAGIAELADEGRVRGAVEHFYALMPDSANTELGDRARDLIAVAGALTLPAEDGGYPRPVQIDDRAREQLLKLLAKVRPDILKIVEQSTARHAKKS